MADLPQEQRKPRLIQSDSSEKGEITDSLSRMGNVLHDVPKGHEIIVTSGTVHTVIDGNEPDIVLREKDLRTETYFQIVSSDSAHAHGKKNTDLVCFYHGDHALPFRTVEVGTGKTVVHEKLDFAETLFFCVFLENRLLRRDLSRVDSP